MFLYFFVSFEIIFRVVKMLIIGSHVSFKNNQLYGVLDLDSRLTDDYDAVEGYINAIIYDHII